MVGAAARPDERDHFEHIAIVDRRVGLSGSRDRPLLSSTATCSAPKPQVPHELRHGDRTGKAASVHR